jgi:hypothetical protein
MTTGAGVVFSANDAGYVRDEVCFWCALEGCLSNSDVPLVVVESLIDPSL